MRVRKPATEERKENRIEKISFFNFIKKVIEKSINKKALEN